MPQVPNSLKDWNGSVTPIISTQFALGHNVSDKLREKIIKGFYVDMASLLANTNTQDEGEI